MPAPDSTTVVDRHDKAMRAMVGLCPLIASADSLLKGLALAAATVAVLAASALGARALRGVLMPATTTGACLLIIAASVAVLDVLLQGFAFEMHLALGASLYLVVANCVIVSHTLQVAAPLPAVGPIAKPLQEGALLAVVLVLLGALRELLGHGSLLDGATDLLGVDLALQGLDENATLALAAVPAGAFFTLALLLVLWRIAFTRGPAR